MTRATLPTTEVRVSGPWMGDPRHPDDRYSIEWEPDEWDDDDEDEEGDTRKEWFPDLDAAIERARELLAFRLNPDTSLRMGV